MNSSAHTCRAGLAMQGRARLNLVMLFKIHVLNVVVLLVSHTALSGYMTCTAFLVILEI